MDCAIIGGGAVGLAIAKTITQAGYTCLVLERAPHFITGASGGNSGIMCTGFDAPHDSLEFKLIRRSIPLMLSHVKRCGLPHRPCGSLVVAFSPAEAERLPAIIKENHVIGDKDVRSLTRAETLALEPHLSPDVVASVLIPGEVVVDPWALPASYLYEAEENGAVCIADCNVASVAQSKDSDGMWCLQTNRGPFRAKVVINAAGNFADKIESMRHAAVGGSDSGSSIGFEMRPRLDVTKGIFVYSTLYGHIIVGPTSEESSIRQDAIPDPDVAQRLKAHAFRVLPELTKARVVGEWVGIRPATQYRDYQIHSYPAVKWITCAGIRSTGLTASLGIGDYVCNDLLRNMLPTPSGQPRPVKHSPLQTTVTLTTDSGSVFVQQGRVGSKSEAFLKVTHPITRLGMAKL